MATKREHDDEPQRRFPTVYVLVGFLVAVAAASLAFGPDSWMNALITGSTSISTHAAKLTLGLISVVILVGLMVPFVKHSLH